VITSFIPKRLDTTAPENRRPIGFFGDLKGVLHYNGH
jgi:hypothetical protein